MCTLSFCAFLEGLVIAHSLCSPNAFKLIKFVVWPRIWPLLADALGKAVYSAVDGWQVLSMAGGSGRALLADFLSVCVPGLGEEVCCTPSPDSVGTVPFLSLLPKPNVSDVLGQGGVQADRVFERPHICSFGLFFE